MLSPADMVSKRADVLIDRGRFQEAQSLLLKSPSQTTAERRRRDNLLGQVLMRQGQWKQALEHLTITRASLGDHLMLIADIADCQLALGHKSSFRETLGQLEENFRATNEFVSFETFLRASQRLGRFLEREGQAHRALGIFRLVFSRLAKAGLEDLTVSCLPDLVRLEACFRIKAHLAQDYRELKMRENFHPLSAENFALQEALLLAELQLGDITAAKARLESILENDFLSGADKLSLLLSFHGESILMGGTPLLSQSHFLKTVGDLENSQMTQAESALLGLLSLSGTESPDLQTLMKALAGLPLTSVLYLLSIAVRVTHHSQTREEIKSQWALCLAALDEASQSLWRGRVGSGPETQQLRVESKSGMISFQGKSFSLKTRKNLYRLTLALGKTEEIGLGALTHLLWEASYNESYYPRIRTAVRRLNQVIAELTAQEKAVEVNKNGVRLNGNLRIQLQ
ncbi:MAG: hypothetical protein H6624_05350 [Bdellovibrionaceae bacterium]|nr:hypothetical protein [Bdellovibrionales bacterium]MCB9083745.1 hypothetical protein [Pseudobdellovibrionaceae bacterium]